LQAGWAIKLTRYAPTRIEIDLSAFNCHQTATMNISQGFQCLVDGHRLALRSVNSCVRKPRGWRAQGGKLMPEIRHWKPREADGEADRGEQIRLRSIAIKAGEVLKTIAAERGRSRRHCLIFPLLIGCTEVCAVFRCVLIGCTDVALCCDVDLPIGCIGSECSFVA
jgi:hypothetical protein